MLYVERSNRIENLLDGLAERLASPRPDPLSTSVVVVQGQGMERWIAQSVARKHGVCANTEFWFPRHLIEAVFGQAEAQLSSAANPAALEVNRAWGIDQLVWAVAGRIAADRDAPELAPLARQLTSPDGDWRLVQLAQQIAARFDDYITYRPDWVARWVTLPATARPTELGADEAWQAWLFRRVYADLGAGHFADRASHFLARVRSGDREALAASFALAFPNGIEVFAVSTLPPLHLRVLDGVAELIDVRMSVLSPSRHYWADLWGELRDADRAATASATGEPVAPIAPAAAGAASLLVGLGRLGSDFQAQLEDGRGYVESGPDRFESPLGATSHADSTRPTDHATNRPTLLRRLQSLLFELDDADPSDRAQPIADDDRSIQVHFCHGAKRELEVVEAALREAFERDATLTPEDVIVMAPQIDEWVPVIDAVFSGRDSGVADSGGAAEADTIPYRIADRSTLRGSPVAFAFVRLLEILTGRAGRSEILEWLSLEPARARLGLDAEGVDRLGAWAARAGIRFGFDASHRESLGLEPLRRHTWAGGIDRLVLGHALGASAETVDAAGSGPLAPEPLDDFSDPALLGAVGELEAALSKARRECGDDRSVIAWGEWLKALLSATLERRDDNAHEHGLVRNAIGRLQQAAGAVSFDRDIPFEAMRERFKRAIEATPTSQGFLSGGVTFCELVPLRAIPFRVVAIVGLSDTNFPRRRPAASYDLMRLYPRRGDRNLRSDDRYLFLEALLSARDEWILTVPSRDLRDGARQPPSVVVSELLDALDASFEIGSTTQTPRKVRDHVVVEHPMHSFSPRYFEADADPRFVGLDAEAFEGARTHRAALESGGGIERCFLEDLPASDDREAAETGVELRLDEMIQRILRSTRVFARERLGLRLPRPERAVADFDPVDLDPLDQYGLGNSLLAERFAGIRGDVSVRRLAASPVLPEGEPGRLAAQTLASEVSMTFGVAVQRFAESTPADRAFELALGDVPSVGPARLTGILRNHSPQGLRRVDFARLGRRAELEFWIQHLVFCALTADSPESELCSLMVSRAESTRSADRVASFSFVPDAKRELQALFAWAWSVDRAPLAFFPKTSRAFARHGGDPAKADQAWREAHQQFYGGDSGSFGFPEFEEELEYARIWEGHRPLESDRDRSMAFGFEELAQGFFATFLAHREVFER